MTTIFYGVAHIKNDITAIALTKCVSDGILTIPVCDHTRASIFGDAISGIVKSIFVDDGLGNITEFNPDQIVIIDTSTTTFSSSATTPAVPVETVDSADPVETVDLAVPVETVDPAVPVETVDPIVTESVTVTPKITKKK